MDGANKQSAVIAEATYGTTPSSPAFKVLRDIRVSGAPDRPATPSPERNPTGQITNMVTGNFSFPKSIDLPFVRDDAADILLESVMGAAWATNVLKVGFAKKGFTLEEKYEGGSTDPYRRLTGCVAGALALNFPQAGAGNPGTMSFGIMALAEAMGTTAIASSTYASPNPGYDPVSLIGLTFTDLFSVSSPKVVGFQMSMGRQNRNRYSHGSASPFDIGFGTFVAQGQVQLYFSAAADYSTFMTRQSGLALDMTIGTQANNKDQIQLGNVDVWNPDIDDPGKEGDHLVRLNFLGRYKAADASSVIWTRNVA